MSRVEDLLQSYIKEHREGGEADPREFLREVSGAERDELAALIDRYLARAPAKPFDPEAFERFRSDPRWQALAERILAPTLDELRAQAELSKRDVAEALARDLDVVGHEAGVRARYHELETGQLEPERIAPRVWAALAGMLGQSAERLREIVEATRESAGGGEAATAFVRQGARAAPASSGTAAPQAASSDDVVDSAFFEI